MKPMLDYNLNSSYQASINHKANQLLLNSGKFFFKKSFFLKNLILIILFLAQLISKRFPKEMNIVDFGCSHGKNSMISFKSTLEGLKLNLNQRKNITLYFNDLPSNDFHQVLDLLQQPTNPIHPYLQTYPINTMINGKSFYTRCFPNQHLHLGFSFFSLHWLATAKPLSNSIVTKSPFVTRKESKQLALQAKLELNQFLLFRASEFKIGGHLILTLPKDSNMQSWIDVLWKRYLKSNGYHHDQFSQVFIPAYHRSDYEISLALQQVKSLWKPKLRTLHNNQGSSFTPSTLKAATFNLILDGVIASKLFPNLTLATQFTNQFYDSLGNDWNQVKNTTHMLILERI